MRRVVGILALTLLPATLPAQRIASDRAGFAPPVALVRYDTTKADSVAPHRSRAADAVDGALIGVVAGGLGGAIYAQQAAKGCGDGPCLVGLAIPFLAGIGLVVGAVAGALWPVR